MIKSNYNFFDRDGESRGLRNLFVLFCHLLSLDMSFTIMLVSKDVDSQDVVSKDVVS